MPAFCENAERVSVCQLKNDPAAFNHHLVEVTAFVSHDFEDFSVFDPDCQSRFDIWLEYGELLTRTRCIVVRAGPHRALVRNR